MTDTLLVLLYGRVVGELRRDRAGEDPSFAYAADYVSDGSVALSARLPISETPYQPAKVLPFLAGLLPENRDTRERWARRLGVGEDDVFALLSQMGWDCPGAVQFCAPGDLDKLAERDSIYIPVDETGIAQRLRALTDDPAGWSMPDEHWSLGGQQEKFALTWIGDRWHEARGGAATTHIIKPGIAALRHQALVEQVTMTAASSLGVDVAGHRLQCFGDQWGIVVDRFDRFVQSDGRIGRIHQEDFCQALGRLPDRKYESRGGPGLADLMRVVRQQSTDADDDRLALADFLVINAVAGAPDGHSKNISMIRAPGRRWVAPLYDLATGLVYDSDRVERAVAVSIGGERRLARVHARQWDKAASTLGIAPSALRDRVAQLAGGFPAAYDRAVEDAAEVPGAVEVGEWSSEVVRSHCEAILARL